MIEEVFPYILGKGSYGKVYKISKQKVVKVSEWKRGEEIIRENLIEASILSSPSTCPPFAPRTDRVELLPDSNQICVYQEYAGPTLWDITKEMLYHHRVQYLPSLILQGVRALCWLKAKGIVHMDIKPTNLCLDFEDTLRLIDWGFCSIGPCSSTRCYNGTTQFADPSYLTRGRQPSHAYDMMSLGISLLCFIDRMYSEMDDVADEETLKERLRFNERKRWVVAYEKRELWEILASMVEWDEDERATPEEIYNNKYFDSIREDYPLFPVEVRPESPVFESCGEIDALFRRVFESEMPYLYGGVVSRWLRFYREDEPSERYYLQATCVYLVGLLFQLPIDMTRLIGITGPEICRSFLRGKVCRLVRALGFQMFER